MPSKLAIWAALSIVAFIFWRVSKHISNSLGSLMSRVTLVLALLCLLCGAATFAYLTNLFSNIDQTAQIEEYIASHPDLPKN